MSDFYYVIPDIHGRYDLMEKAIRAVPKGCDIIFLGDYIDRGPQSGKVIKTLMDGSDDHNFICLRGNHEDMFLEHFSQGDGWPLYDKSAAKNIGKIVGVDEAIKWIRELPYFHIRDKNVFAHAYYSDRLRPENQNLNECVWFRFLTLHSPYENSYQGFFLTHGHTPHQNNPIQSENRVNLDRAAFHTGELVLARYKKDIQGPYDYTLVTL